MLFIIQAALSTYLAKKAHTDDVTEDLDLFVQEHLCLLSVGTHVVVCWSYNVGWSQRFRDNKPG